MPVAKAILILAEHLGGTLSGITHELLGAGRRLADAQQAPLHAALFGDGVEQMATQMSLADKVWVIPGLALDALTAGDAAVVLQRLAAQQGAGLILVGGTNLAMGIGSTLSLKMDRPFISFCRNLRVEEGTVLVTSQLFGGKILSEVALPDNEGIVGVYPGAFPAEPGTGRQSPSVEPIEPVSATPSVTFRKFIEPETGDVDITKHRVLVAVGRGMQSEDNVVLAGELAEALGGAVCASRPIIDQGWLPLSRQVGKSGMSVNPGLYVALGISGAPEHVEGMQGSQLIVAINTDAQAPIFGVAQYGVCADALEVLPLLIEKVKAGKGAA
jgi:electron transfer flavoprotein alpha subunit